MRIAWWSIVVGGVTGALLWAGPAGAQGLPGCLRQLGECTASLGTCQTALAACEAEPGVVFPGDGVDGPTLRYTDNRNGTFTDTNTLLMWQTEYTVGGNYTLTNTFGGSALNGSAFTSFLEILNNRCDGASAISCTSDVQCASIGNGKCGLAGHRDWRIPNIKELQSIVDYRRETPASSVPGFNLAGYYWSSTTDASDSSRAWFVSFLGGGVTVLDKFSAIHVRAVRGGL